MDAIFVTETSASTSRHAPGDHHNDPNWQDNDTFSPTPGQTDISLETIAYGSRSAKIEAGSITAPSLKDYFDECACLRFPTVRIAVAPLAIILTPTTIFCLPDL
jgi:hypothetical protein